jgi:hypothetical protein
VGGRRVSGTGAPYGARRTAAAARRGAARRERGRAQVSAGARTVLPLPLGPTILRAQAGGWSG